jgi:hypothetical protein
MLTRNLAYSTITLSNKDSPIILFADDTSVIISEPCLMNFERKLNIVSENEGVV